MQVNDDWRTQACKMLRAGFGVEDIAIKLNVPLEDVRRFVKLIRDNGRMTDVLFGRRYRAKIQG